MYAWHGSRYACVVCVGDGYQMAEWIASINVWMQAGCSSLLIGAMRYIRCNIQAHVSFLLWGGGTYPSVILRS